MLKWGMAELHPLKQWLSDQGLSQGKFARRVRVTDGRLSQILHGESPSMKLAARIKAATKGEITADDLMEAAQ